MEAAPLLFAIVAELPLQQRLKCVEQIDNARDSLREALSASGGHLHLFWPEWGCDEKLQDEEDSIAARDLFAKRVRNRAGLNNEETNPFAQFLTAMLRSLELSAQPVSWSSSSTPEYRICPDEAKKLVGDNEDAVEAILGGAVALYQMPREIRKAPRAERAQWMLSESWQLDASEDFGDFPSEETGGPPSFEDIGI